MFIRWKKRILAESTTAEWVADPRGRKILFEKQVGELPFGCELPKNFPRYYVRTGRQSDDMVFSCQVVESRRIDGKPRQRVVAYLGCIHGDHVQQEDDEAASRCSMFCLLASERLDHLVQSGTITRKDAGRFKSDIVTFTDMEIPTTSTRTAPETIER